VPVCSVGTYQAYLHAACCVCEVLPGALRFTEEGDLLGLVAPRALMVVNATQDGFQFSVGEAQKSLARAKAIFKLYGKDEKVLHATFESPHAYNQQMREAMYGWMTRWLKNEGDGKPIPEPKHDVEKPEDLRCFPDGKRPKGFLFPPSFAAAESRRLLDNVEKNIPKHVEDWESTAVHRRAQLKSEVFGGFPRSPKVEAQLGKSQKSDGVQTTPLVLWPEAGMPVPAILKARAEAKGKMPACVLLHPDGKAEALKVPLAEAL